MKDRNMLAQKFSIKDEFPPVDYGRWRAAAEATLKGASFDQKLVTHTYEGIDLQPLYTRRDALGDDAFGFPGLAPFVRGGTPLGAVKTGWDIRQEHAHPDLRISNRAILDDLQGGVTSVLLKLDHAARCGLDADAEVATELAGRDGITAYCLDDLDEVLADVDLSIIGLALDGGAAFLPAAAMLIALWKRRGCALDQVRGALNADPLGVLARDGRLHMTAADALEQMADLAKWTAENLPNVTSVRVDVSPYHHGGATAAQDIAFAIATGVEYLRALTTAGMDIAAAARQIVFDFSVGTHHFLSIAKLRAARGLWSRVVEASGGPPAAGVMRIHARTSDRVLTQRDPYVNLLRNTVGVFAAGIGGADGITSIPFDQMVGLPDEFSRRVARNTVLILQEEAHLHRVVDPAGGSWFLDRLTDQVAERAWGIFQQVEGEGSLLAALSNGWIAEQIDSAFAPRAKDIARRKQGITGVSEFPNVGEERIVHAAPNPAELRKSAAVRLASSRREVEVLKQLSRAKQGRSELAVEAAAVGASIGQLAAALGGQDRPTEITPLEPHLFAEPFEELRDASDAWMAQTGSRPKVFLASMGPVAHHTARATYAKNFFEAGGFEVISDKGFAEADDAVAAFSDSGVSIAVICSSDKLYPDFVPEVSAKLKAAGAKSVVLAGHPGDKESAWRAAGVDRFIFIKCDVLAILRDLLREQGVLTS